MSPNSKRPVRTATCSNDEISRTNDVIVDGLVGIEGTLPWGFMLVTKPIKEATI